MALLRTSHLLSVTGHLPAPRSPEPGCLRLGRPQGRCHLPRLGGAPGNVCLGQSTEREETLGYGAPAS